MGGGAGRIRNPACVAAGMPGNKSGVPVRRLADGGCLAVLDAFGTCADMALVGPPTLLAPELVQARRGAAVTYTPASDMWCARACSTV